VCFEGGVQRYAVHCHQVGVTHAAADGGFLHARTTVTGQPVHVLLSMSPERNMLPPSWADTCCCQWQLPACTNDIPGKQVHEYFRMRPHKDAATKMG
jgi:hypothetical protein